MEVSNDNEMKTKQRIFSYFLLKTSQEKQEKYDKLVLEVIGVHMQ